MKKYPKRICLKMQSLVLAVLALTSALVMAQAPNFSANFSPSTIAPGGASRLIFTIDNASGSPVRGLSFTNDLPAGLVVAPVPDAESDCFGGSISARPGGTSITFSNGGIPAGRSCTVSVNVVGASLGTVTNTSGDLTSEAGNSGTASADLMVLSNRPTFSASFSPASIRFQERSTLTFTIDNSANTNNLSNLTFSNVLPTGVVIADPSNAFTDCGGQMVTLTAVPGENSVSLSAQGAPFGGFEALAAGDTCTVTVDVIGASSGLKENVSSDLITTGGSVFSASSGFTTSTLEVLAPSLLSISKSFLNDPVLAGDTVDLEYVITNRNRDQEATEIAFSDDLGSVLPGLAASGALVSDLCGVGSELSGTSVLSFSGGRIASGESCRFVVTLSVPSDAAGGSYESISSAVTGDFGGRPTTGDVSSATLFVSENAPIITKTYLTDVVGAGETITAEYSITNSASVAITEVSFMDALDDLVSGLTFTPPAAGFCGPGSILTETQVSSEGFLTLINGSLAAGETCTFTVEFPIPPSASPGVITSTTQAVTATLNGETVTGNVTSDQFTIVGGLEFTKTFVDDPVQPGANATLVYTISMDEESPLSATEISFTDDLENVLPGLVAVGLPLNDVCGAGSLLSGTSMISLTGGQLSPGQSCILSIPVMVPGDAAFGSFSSTSSLLSGVIDGVAVSAPAVTDTLDVVGLTFSQRFIDGPYLAGETATLEYTIENLSTTQDTTGLQFTHLLNNALGGLSASGLPLNDVCGSGSSLASLGAANNFLLFSGGTLAAGESCSFQVEVIIPANAAVGSYLSSTSALAGAVGGSPVSVPIASAPFEVIEPLSITKNFLSNPVIPGAEVVLEYTIENLDTNSAITEISFMDDFENALTGLSVTSAAQSDLCGSGSSLSGTSVISLTGGNLAPGESCSFQVTLTVPESTPLGSMVTSTSSAVTGMVEGFMIEGEAASDLLEVSSLRFEKSFTTSSSAGGTVQIDYVIENLSETANASALSFFDDLDAVIPGLTATNLPLRDVCGTGSQLAGDSVIRFNGGSLAPGESCSFSVTLQVPADASIGAFESVSTLLTSSGLDVSPPASASLVINPAPAFSKSFTPNPGIAGEVSTLLYVIDNSASSASAEMVSFTDSLPAGMLIATPANASTTCATGTLTAVASSDVISFVGGSVPGGASCTVTVDVIADAGDYTSVSSDLISSLGNSGSASASLRVNPAPLFDLSFSPNEVLVGEMTTVTYTIDNRGSTVDALEIDFSNALSAGLKIASAPNAVVTCVGGTLTAVADSGVISYTGGTVAAGESCSISVDLVTENAGEIFNQTSELTSSLGNSGTASGTLTVNSRVDLIFSGSESIDPVIAGSGDGNLTHILTVENAGPSDASGVVLDYLLEIPSGTMVQSITPSVGSISETEWTLGELAATESATLTIIYTVDETTAAGSDLVRSTLSVNSANETLVETDDDEISVATSVEAPIDLIVTVGESTDSVVAGSGVGNLIYTVLVNNQGPATATGVELQTSLNLPSGVAVEMVTASAGEVLGESWTIEALGLDETASLTIVLTVSGSAQAGVDVISATATVSASDQLRVNPENDSDTEATSITQSVDLALSVDESSDPFVICPEEGTDSHLVTITNEGPGNASGVVVTIAQTLPTGVSLAEVVTSGSTSFVESSWMVGELAAGASETIRFDFALADDVLGGVDVISTSASVTAVVENDPVSENDAAAEATGVVSSSSLSAETLDPRPYRFFGSFLHKVKVTNNNPYPINAVRLFVGDLPEDAIVRNADGVAFIGDPAAPLSYLLLNETFEAGESRWITVKYLRTKRQRRFTPSYFPVLLKTPEEAVRATPIYSPYPYRTFTWRGAHFFTHPVRVENIGTSPVTNFRLYVSNLPDAVTLREQDGEAEYGLPPEELPYQVIEQSLAPGESRVVYVKYRSRNRRPFVPVYRTTIFDEVELLFFQSLRFPESPLELTEREVEEVTTMAVIEEHGNLLEWTVVPGQRYQVEFSDDLNDWTRDPEIITAEEPRLQWFDDGEVTSSSPLESAKRYYRLIEVK